MALQTQDNHPALAIKDACLARSGVYFYTYDEMVARGHVPKTKKAIYSEYRPPEVLARCKDKFAFAAVTKEHTLHETNPDNFRLQASGIVGDNLTIQELTDGNTGIFGKMAFYTKDAYEYYKAGNKETSADYKSLVVPDLSGQYDYILKDIMSVNGVVVTARGRGGPNVRVQDSAKNMFGGIKMAGKTGIFAGLFGRSKDEGFKLSKVVLDGARTFHTLDAAGQEKCVNDIMAHITDLPDGENKERLIGAVKDSLRKPLDAVKHEETVARVIDGLYDATFADDKETQDLIKKLAEGKTQDSEDDEAKKKADAEAKAKEEEGRAKDAAAAAGSGNLDKLIDLAVEKSMTRVTDSINALVDKAVAKALGVQTPIAGKKAGEAGSSTQDSVDDITREDGSFLLDGHFNG